MNQEKKEKTTRKKEVLLSPQGFFYYLDDNDQAIITNGKKPYVHNREELVVPESIDGHVVVGIGENAFHRAIFGSLILPDSVRTICRNAFDEAKFDLLVLPEKLEELDPEAFGNDDVIKEEAIDSDPSDEEIDNDGPFWLAVVLPKEIANKDRNVSISDFLAEPTVGTFDSSLHWIPREDFQSFLHDGKEKTWGMLLLDGNVRLLLSYKATRPEEVPTVFMGKKVTQWDASLLVQLACLQKERVIEGPQKLWKTFEWFRLKWQAVNPEIRIPDNVERITSKYLSYRDSDDDIVGTIGACHILATPKLKSIDGFSSRLPILLENEKGIQDRIFFRGKTYPIDRKIQEDGIGYCVWKMDGKEVACAIEVDDSRKCLSLPKEVQGIEVQSALLTIPQKLDSFETYQRNWIKDDDASFAYYFIDFVQGVKQLKIAFDPKRSDELDFTAFLFPNLRVDDVLVSEGFSCHSSCPPLFAKPLEATEVSIHLPSSMKYFYPETFADGNITRIFVHETTENRIVEDYFMVRTIMDEETKKKLDDACRRENSGDKEDYVLEFLNEKDEIIRSDKGWFLQAHR